MIVLDLAQALSQGLSARVETRGPGLDLLKYSLVILVRSGRLGTIIVYLHYSSIEGYLASHLSKVVLRIFQGCTIRISICTFLGALTV